MKGEPVGYVKEFRYLGVILDEKLSFIQHFRYVSEKAVKTFCMVRRAAKANWGLGSKALLTLYKGVGEAILLYGATVWAEKMRLTYADILLRAQRTMLLAVTKGYRTVSREALTVLAGVMPIDLKALEREQLYNIRVGRGGNRVQIRREAMIKWQERWDRAETGRRTYQLFPDVSERLRKKIDVNHYVTQFLTGHGNFAAYLKRFGIRDNELCGRCNVVDTPEHVIYDCIEIADSRSQFRIKLMDVGMRLDLRQILQNAEATTILVDWLKEVALVREGRERM